MLVIRPAIASDVDAMYRLAAGAGNGLTNIPVDRDALAERLLASEETLSGKIDDPAKQQVRLVMERDGAVLGIAAVWPRVGHGRPFYSYKISQLAHVSSSTGKRMYHRLLTLVSELDGCSEIGGLLLDPSARGGGLGRVLARSRYMFIAAHRDMFAGRIFAELRGYQDEHGRFPFWEAVGCHFYGMSFEEADRLSGIPDHPIIAELGPRYPIYINMLPEDAQAAIGTPHRDGRAAVTMLEAEGFAGGDYVDIFDGGPTMICMTDSIKTIRELRSLVVLRSDEFDTSAAAPVLAAHGEGADFRCIHSVGIVGEGEVRLPTIVAESLGAASGEAVLVARG